MKNPVLTIIARRWRSLLGFALLFRVLESFLWAPLAAWLGQWLLGRTVLDSTAVVSFVLSPRGFLALALAATLAVSVRLFEHAGLSVIFFGALEGRRVTAKQALQAVASSLVDLIHVAARLVGLGLITLLPLALVVGIFAARLLPRHDINYYLHRQPPEFLLALSVVAVAAIATLGVGLWLAARWRWVVQATIFERRNAASAFAESVRLTRGWRARILVTLTLVVLIAAALTLLASVAGSLITALVLRVVSRGSVSLALTFGCLLTMRTFVGAFATYLSSSLDAGVFTSWYRRRRAGLSGEAALPLSAESSAARPVRWPLAAALLGALGLAGSSAWLALDAISREEALSIHAHRGVTTRAPENTLTAVRDAIEEGADFVEIDVQLSKDDVLVVAHDSDFSRLGGVPKKVWDLTYDEIRRIPLGDRTVPNLGYETTPTFDAVLAEAKGRIRVNIELKYYANRQPDLARKVVNRVDFHDMADQVVIQCLEYAPLMEVQQLAPEIPIGYLLSFNTKEPARLSVDFLSVEQSRLNRRFIQRAHQQGQQVFAWTVNTEAAMRRVLDLGADGVITDQTALARQVFERYRDQPSGERADRRIRAWLAH